jgi:hypothetical protein
VLTMESGDEQAAQNMATDEGSSTARAVRRVCENKDAIRLIRAGVVSLRRTD